MKKLFGYACSVSLLLFGSMFVYWLIALIIIRVSPNSFTTITGVVDAKGVETGDVLEYGKGFRLIGVGRDSSSVVKSVDDSLRGRVVEGDTLVVYKLRHYAIAGNMVYLTKWEVWYNFISLSIIFGFVVFACIIDTLWEGYSFRSNDGSDVAGCSECCK